MPVDFAKRTAERCLRLISSFSANSLPAARLYAWEEKDDEFSGGSVHAKVAVADGRVCFITSANLTGHAMAKNMEAGVLISGGQIPKLLDGHLTSLFHTNLVTRV